jgi:NTP pyrophosphatase (non-canonical NTP hydrolase)
MDNKSREILLIAQEECAEVTQAISKIFRFGLEAKHPQRSETNKEHLSEEIGDLLSMIDLMAQQDIISWKEVLIAKESKREKLRKWSNIIQDNGIG